MNNRLDHELLRDYAEHGDEAAFTELVRRHVDLVYATAVRLVANRHLAEDVTQAVFVALAQNAPRLAIRTVLSSWLYLATRNLAAKAVRTEVRRRAREQEAAMMQTDGAETQSAWEKIAPYFDAALSELKEADRDALLLRFFERKTAREIAARFGLTEEAAQKRMTRALDRFRDLLAARGVAISSAALAGAISPQAMQAAPAALVGSLAAKTLAKRFCRVGTAPARRHCGSSARTGTLSRRTTRL